jgi:putative molybdopterin biosynthesis protein
MEVRNNLALLRNERGISAAKLASLVGISRQTIYAIEAGSYVPNTSVSLNLARVLNVTVEQLFELERDVTPASHVQEIELLPPSGKLQPGQPLQICSVKGRLIGTYAGPGTWGLPPADAVVFGPGRSSSRSLKIKAELFEENDSCESRVLVAGCDPSVPILARHVQRQGFELIVSYQNSSRALDLLKQGLVHVAGTHIRDEKTGESNLPIIEKLFGKGSMAVFSFALWEEGLVVAKGNPKNIHSVADLVRPDVKITNREAGAGCRILLDSLLHRIGASGNQVKGYDRVAFGHLPAARQVWRGEADCCIATGATARFFGLDFAALTTKRYDLVVRRSHLKLPQVGALIEVLGRTSFRRELEGFTGYDMKSAGDRLA